MNASSVPSRRPLLIFADAFNPRAGTVIFSLGVVIWIAATLAFGFNTEGTNFSYSLLSCFESTWQLGFFWGLGGVLILAALHCLKAKKNPLGALVYVVIFASPFALFLIGSWVLDGIYNGHPATVEMNKLFGAIFILFYILGIAYMGWKAPRGNEDALPAFMLPTYTTVVLVLLFTGFRLFTSTEYIYRDAFELRVKSADVRDGQPIQVEGVLTINKAGPYVFSAISNDFAMMPEENAQPPVIEWLDGAKAPASEGSHPFRITYTSQHPVHPLLTGDPGQGPMMGWEMGPQLYLQISLPAHEDQSAVFIKSIPVALEVY